MTRLVVALTTIAAMAAATGAGARGQTPSAATPDAIRTYTVQVDSIDGKPVQVDGSFWVDGGIPHAQIVHRQTPFTITDAGTVADGLFSAARGAIRVRLSVKGGGSASAEGPVVAVVEGLAPAAGRGFLKTFGAADPR